MVWIPLGKLSYTGYFRFPIFYFFHFLCSFKAQNVPHDVVNRLHGNRVAVSPIVTVEPRRRKFHKPITLTIPLPQGANRAMITQQYQQGQQSESPTLRLLCSITGARFFNSLRAWLCSACETMHGQVCERVRMLA